MLETCRQRTLRIRRPGDKLEAVEIKYCLSLSKNTAANRTIFYFRRTKPSQFVDHGFEASPFFEDTSWENGDVLALQLR